MENRKIGQLTVSVVGLGTNNFGARIDEKRSAAVLHSALEAGINFVDTADIYGGSLSEEYIGNALRGLRDEVVLATKFGGGGDRSGGASPAYTRRALEESLRRLRTDHVDLYILHQPDPNTPIGDTLAALNELLREGKVRELGCSNFTLDQLKEAEAATDQGARGFVNLQNLYNLLQREAERDVLPECERAGIAFVPYFPLASGLLTGKYRRGEGFPEGTRLAGMDEERRSSLWNDENLATIDRLAGFCRARGRSLLELAISWLLSRPAVASVIAGATSPEQVAANVAASGWKLSEEELAEVDELAPIR